MDSRKENNPPFSCFPWSCCSFCRPNSDELDAPCRECLASCCCPHYLYATIRARQEVADNTTARTFCLTVNKHSRYGTARRNLKTKNNVKEETWCCLNDDWIACCCTSCSLTQEIRQLNRLDKSDKSTHTRFCCYSYVAEEAAANSAAGRKSTVFNPEDAVKLGL